MALFKESASKFKISSCVINEQRNIEKTHFAFIKNIIKMSPSSSSFKVVFKTNLLTK